MAPLYHAVLPSADNLMHPGDIAAMDDSRPLEKTPETDASALDSNAMEIAKPKEIQYESNIVELQSDVDSLRKNLDEDSSLAQEEKLDKVPDEMLDAGMDAKTTKDAARECETPFASNQKEPEEICDVRKEDAEEDLTEITEVLNFLDESIDYEPLGDDEKNLKPANEKSEGEKFTSETNLKAELQAIDVNQSYTKEEQGHRTMNMQEEEHPLSSRVHDSQLGMEHESRKEVDEERGVYEESIKHRGLIENRLEVRWNLPESDNHVEHEQVIRPKNETKGVPVVVCAEPSDSIDGATIKESQLPISDRSVTTDTEISSASDQKELDVICDAKKDDAEEDISEITEVLNYLDENIDYCAVGMSDSLIYTTSPMRKNKESVSLELDRFDRIENGKATEDIDSQSDREASDDEQDVSSDGDDIEIVEMMGLDYSLNEISRSFIKEVMMDAIRDVKSDRKRRESRHQSTDSVSHSDGGDQDLENISEIETMEKDQMAIGSDHADRVPRLSVVKLSPQVCCRYSLCLPCILLCATLALSCCMCMYFMYLSLRVRSKNLSRVAMQYS